MGRVWLIGVADQGGGEPQPLGLAARHRVGPAIGALVDAGGSQGPVHVERVGVVRRDQAPPARPRTDVDTPSIAVVTTRGVSTLLLGRKNERQVLDEFLAATRKGEGGALVVHGDPGIGKTALLEYAVGSATGFDVFRTVGNESEMELPYAALLELCRPGPGELAQLPELQRNAIEVVLGRRGGVAPDRVLVGVALVSLLSALGAERPLLWVVDDAQWLDSSSAQAIAFAARRISREAVAFLFGARTLTDEVRGLPKLLRFPALGTKTVARIGGAHRGCDGSLRHRAPRPPVGEDQRDRARAAAGLAHEVHRDPGDADLVMVVGVDGGLGLAPVVAVSPVGDQPTQIAGRDAIEPIPIPLVQRRTGQRETGAQVIEDLVGCRPALGRSTWRRN